MKFTKALQQSIALILVSQLSFQFAGQLATANTDFRPSWLGIPGAPVAPNQSFLSDTRSNMEAIREEAFVDQIMDRGRAAELRQDYERVTRAYHQEQAFGLIDPTAELAWMDRFDQKRREALREVRRHKVGQTRNEVRGAAKRGEISAPVMVSSTLASLYFGTPVNVDIDQAVRISAKTDFIDDRAQVKITSNVVDGALDIAGDSHMNQDVDPSRREERYRVSLTRQLPVWDLSSGVAYGGTTKSLSASIAKPLSDNLTCVVDTRQRMDQPAAKTENTLTFQYGLRF